MDIEQAFWLRISNPTNKPSDVSPVKIDAPKELLKVSLVNESLKKLKFHLAKFDNVIGDTMNMDEKRKESCDLEAELLKSQNAFNELLKQFFANNDLKAQLQDKDSTICKLKDIIKSMREKFKEGNVEYDYGEIETKNMELDNSAEKIILENERLCNEINHVKQVFKKNFNSIKKTCVRTKEQSDSLFDKLNLKSAKNEDLKAQIQDKVVQIVLWYLDSRCLKHMTGNRSQLMNFVSKIYGFGVDAAKELKEKHQVFNAAGEELCAAKQKLINPEPREDYVARKCSYKEFMTCQPFNFMGSEGAIGLIRWFERTESVFSCSNYTKDYKVKFATGTLIEEALSWWNSFAQPIRIEEAYKITWIEFKKLLIKKYCPQTEIQKMEDEFYHLTVKGNDLKTYVRRFQELETLCLTMVLNSEKFLEAFIRGFPRSIEGNVTASKPQTLEEAINIAQSLMDQVTRHTMVQVSSDHKRKFDDRRTFNNNNYRNTNTNNRHNKYQSP
nr:reverse transcriptase domain-containing protein [Tanacetum cinerariifolium]